MSAARRHVLVTDAGRGSAVAFIRSLGRRGWRVTAADSDPTSAGFRSRHASDRLVYPNPAEHPDAVVATIRRTVIAEGVDLVIPITDEIGLPLAAAREAFAGHAILALPDPAALAATHDKAATLALAERLGVPIPPTRTVASIEEAPAAAAALGYPLVLKPASSRELLADRTIGSYTVTYAGDDADLRRGLDGLDAATSVLLQRWLPGEGVGVELLMDHGRPLAAFQHRRLREVPVTGGASALRESVALDADLLDHATRLLAAISWTGLAMVEFRRSPDGTAQLMEINGRVWGSLPLAVRAGMDFPGRWADLLLDGPPPDEAPLATGYRVGVRARNLRLELAWIGAVLTGRRRYPYLPWPSRRAAIGAVVSLFDPRIGDDLLSRSDPGPGLAQFVAIARHGLRAGRRRRG
ncbi:MAG: carboxylate--amine ligase [Candidatus Limnocylindrales bacterium]